MHNCSTQIKKTLTCGIKAHGLQTCDFPPKIILCFSLMISNLLTKGLNLLIFFASIVLAYLCKLVVCLAFLLIDYSIIIVDVIYFVYYCLSFLSLFQILILIPLCIFVDKKIVKRIGWYIMYQYIMWMGFCFHFYCDSYIMNT